MNRYALIDGSNVVRFLAVASSPGVFAATGLAAELVPASVPVEIGWTFAAGVFSPPVPTLDEAKLGKMAQIDADSAALFASGFVFAGLVFSLSPEAQAEYARLEQFSATAPYPFSIPTLDEMASVPITSAADVAAFIAPAQARVGEVLVPGEALKDQVRACTTVAQVDAIVDNRK